jgi:hypothetical protein
MNFLKRKALDLAVRHSRRFRLAQARKWLTWYMREINGSGLRCEFERLPESASSVEVESIADMATRHTRDLDSLDARIAGFDDLREFLDACPRFWPQPNGLGYLSDKHNQFLKREVTDEALTYLLQMHEGLAFYAKLLRKYAGTIDVIEDAALAVAGVINPVAWRNAGRRTPHISYGADAGIRYYLEAIIATEGRILPAHPQAS